MEEQNRSQRQPYPPNLQHGHPAMADQEAHAPEQQHAPNRGPADEKYAHFVHPWPGRSISRETQFGAHGGNGDREQASETEDLQTPDLRARVARSLRERWH